MKTKNNTESQHKHNDVSGTSTLKNKPKAHIIRRNVEDYLEQKALERRIGEVFDERLGFGW